MEWLGDLLGLGKMYYTCRDLNEKIYVPVKLLHKVSTGAGTNHISEMHTVTPDASFHWLSVDLHKHVVLGYCALTVSIWELDSSPKA